MALCIVVQVYCRFGRGEKIVSCISLTSVNFYGTTRHYVVLLSKRQSFTHLLRHMLVCLCLAIPSYRSATNRNITSNLRLTSLYMLHCLQDLTSCQVIHFKYFIGFERIASLIINSTFYCHRNYIFHVTFFALLVRRRED